MLTSRILVLLRIAQENCEGCYHSAVKVIVKLYGGDHFLWDSVMPQDFPKTVFMNAIKCFLKIHKVDIKFSLSFCTLFDDVPESEDLIDTTLSFPKFNFSSLNLLSTTLLDAIIDNNLLPIILARILVGMESTMIPRQLLQSFNAPFFRILVMVVSFQSSGILLSSQTFVMRGRRISAAVSEFVLKSFARFQLDCDVISLLILIVRQWGL